MAASPRMYLITESGAPDRLVAAPNPNGALMHVIGQKYTVKAVKAFDVAKLMSDGVQLETATARKPRKARKSATPEA